MSKKQLFTSFPVTAHTDYVASGTTFVVIKGLTQDGSHYIAKAVEKGAHRIVVEHGTVLAPDITELLNARGIPVDYVENARQALAVLSAQAAGYPAQKLKFFGVGETKGKTTTVCMLAHLLKLNGKKVAFLSTALIGMFSSTQDNDLADFDCAGTLTTPQPDYLHQFFKLCVEKGIEYMVLEVAAQAHTFHRLETIEFEGVIFTNLDREHGELYPSMEQYFKEKQKLFSHLKPNGVLLSNNDDPYGQRILETFPQAKSFGVYSKADYRATLCADSLFEQEALIETPHHDYKINYCGFPGAYNLSNVVAAFGLLAQAGIALDEFSKQLIVFPPVPGRLEMHPLANGAVAVIDYAHTAASFEQVLSLMRPRTQQLLVVFGAGGGKDSAKRPFMGEVAARLADFVFVTDDNPRFEDPKLITEQIVSGVQEQHRHKVHVIHDRQAAIQAAYQMSQPGSIVMLLGKGPDTVQIVNSERLYFNEKQVLKALQVFIPIS